MASLDRTLRKDLENAIKKARRVAETGARHAIDQLAVSNHEPWSSMTPQDRQLRNRLRAHGRQLGDRRDEKKGTQEIDHLAGECAYEHWHRLLFARFLAENGLLIEPGSGMPLSLDECRELARERGVDWLALASEFAEKMLPQIFRAGDPVLDVKLPPERRHELEAILEALPPAVFTADDSLGWVYQFWQSERKDAVNASETKIGADELPAVTQLFTEDYMVLFLLHNTLGAWWAAKRKAEGKDHQLPGYEWTYLRFKEDGTPAAGSYEGWPREAKAVTILDPCMGSGHFLVFALPILVGMRIEEEGLSREAAVDAVVAQNLHGLEIDPRCTQIAAFNLALAAWKLGGYRSLPPLNLACAGLGINAGEEEWLTLAGRDARLKGAMRELYRLFEQAPILGSLIDPKRAVKGDLLTAGFEDVERLLEVALTAEKGDEGRGELAVMAKGILKAASVLSGRFTLVATNVPFLGSGKQDPELAAFLFRYHRAARSDLATCMIERVVGSCAAGGSAAFVSPQAWFYQAAYEGFRAIMLKRPTWNIVCRVGTRGFDAIGGEVVNIALTVVTQGARPTTHQFAVVDISEDRTPHEKAKSLQTIEVTFVKQSDQLDNPNHKVTLTATESGVRLGTVASSFLGLGTGDFAHYGRCFWELQGIAGAWVALQSTVEQTEAYSGREHVIAWDSSAERVSGMTERERAQIHNQDQSGQQAWGRPGVAVGLVGQLRATLYSGEKFEKALAVICPRDPHVVPALWEYCRSDTFRQAVRSLDKGVAIANGTFEKVVFDLDRWQRAAKESNPRGLPKPESDALTQWLFSGYPKGSRSPLHVAVARLVGYCWPRQTGSMFMDCPALGPDGLEECADADGIVCLPPLRGEPGAADRLRALLSKAYGRDWSAAKLSELLTQVGADSLEEWLQADFFKQHCDLFHQRPFVWHVWDGVKDGFSVLVNYHKLAGPKGEGRRTLESLAYAYLGDWIAKQKADVAAAVDGADLKVAAATHLQGQLEKILGGEPPYDIFVRWKPLSQQAVGWDPDVNDGVRMNIRPFMAAAPLSGRGSILRASPSIKWGKDKGKEPERPKAEYPWFWGWDGTSPDFGGGVRFDGNRWNDLHYSRGVKQSARERAKRGGKS